MKSTHMYTLCQVLFPQAARTNTKTMKNRLNYEHHLQTDFITSPPTASGEPSLCSLNEHVFDVPASHFQANSCHTYIQFCCTAFRSSCIAVGILSLKLLLASLAAATHDLSCTLLGQDGSYCMTLATATQNPSMTNPDTHYRALFLRKS